MDGGEGEGFFVLLVEGERGIDVHIADAVAVGEEEVLVVSNVVLNAFDATGGEGVFACVGECDGPIFFVVVTVVGELRFGAKLQGDIVGQPLVVAEEVLDHFALVPEAEDEMFVSLRRVGLHDVP